MIGTSSRQSGSVHAVIAVIVSIIIIGVLGFVFWQNFMDSKEEKKSANPETSHNELPVTPRDEEVVELSETYIVPTEKLAISYPKEWKLYSASDKVLDGPDADHRALLVSPDNFALQITIPSQGPNLPFGERPLACPFDKSYQGFQGGDDDHPDVCPFYKELLSKDAPNLDGVAIKVFESSWESPDIAPTHATLMLVNEGCTMPERDFCERPSAKTGYFLYAQGGFYNKVDAAAKKNAYIETGYGNLKRVKADDFVKDKDVTTAIAILQSLKYN